MRRAALALLVLSLSAAGCSDNPCQVLGEKLCGCTGADGDTCTAQVQTQLEQDELSFDETLCQDRLDTCEGNLPAGADFCAWLGTADGKIACGLAP